MFFKSLSEKNVRPIKNYRFLSLFQQIVFSQKCCSFTKLRPYLLVKYKIFFKDLDKNMSHTLGIGSPLLIPCLISKYYKWYIIGKLLCSTFRMCKKICKFAKTDFFCCKIQLYSKIVCKKIIFQKIINYTYLKSPWPCHFKYAKSFAKF